MWCARCYSCSLFGSTRSATLPHPVGVSHFIIEPFASSHSAWLFHSAWVSNRYTQTMRSSSLHLSALFRPFRLAIVLSSENKPQLLVASHPTGYGQCSEWKSFVRSLYYGVWLCLPTKDREMDALKSMTMLTRSALCSYKSYNCAPYNWPERVRMTQWKFALALNVCHHRNLPYETFRKHLLC